MKTHKSIFDYYVLPCPDRIKSEGQQMAPPLNLIRECIAFHSLRILKLFLKPT